MTRAIVLYLILILSGCSSGASDDQPKFIPWTYFDSPPEPIELSLETRSVSKGLKLDLYIENKSDTTHKLAFGGFQRGQPYNFVVIDTDSFMVWLEYNGTIDAVATIVPIPPGKSLVHSTIWELDSNYGREISASVEYMILGYGTFSNDWNNSLGLNEQGVYVTGPVLFKLE